MSALAWVQHMHPRHCSHTWRQHYNHVLEVALQLAEWQECRLQLGMTSGCHTDQRMAAARENTRQVGGGDGRDAVSPHVRPAADLRRSSAVALCAEAPSDMSHVTHLDAMCGAEPV